MALKLLKDLLQKINLSQVNEPTVTDSTPQITSGLEGFIQFAINFSFRFAIFSIP